MTENEQEMIPLKMKIPRGTYDRLYALSSEDLKTSIKESAEILLKLKELPPEIMTEFVAAGVIPDRTFKYLLITGLYFTIEAQNLMLEIKEKKGPND